MTIHQEIQTLEARLADTADYQAQAEIILDILGRYVRIRSTDGQIHRERLLMLADATGSMRYRAWSIYYQAIAIRLGGDYVTALDLTSQALEIFIAEQDEMGIASCHNGIGNIYQYQGNYTEALKNHLQALRIREQIGDKNGIANSYTNISLVYSWLKDYDAALENSRLSLQIMEEVGNKQGMANAYTNIGIIYCDQGRFDEALQSHLSCQQIEVATGNDYGVAISQTNIGNIYLRTGDYEQALSHYVPARRVFEEQGIKQMNALLLTNIGEVYYAQGLYTTALDMQLQALTICEEVGHKEEIARTCECLTKTYSAMQDYENALKYYDRYHNLDKEMAGQQAQKQVLQLNFQHNMELKEKEAQLLKEKNEAINIYAQKLEVSNNELKQFANVASHDLREPLRMVTSYMNLLERTMGDDIQPAQKQFIGFAVDGAKRMEQLIHDLLRLAKVDANPQIEPVSLTVIVDEVRSNLEILLREKNAQIITTALPTIMADRTQIMQLCQNIIGNGIKYNEHTQPTITIGYSTTATEALLSIADNGIGIPPEYRERAFQIFQRVPTQKQYQGTGIGLAICKKIVDGLGGRIAIDDHTGGGTVFHITIPMSVVVT